MTDKKFTDEEIKSSLEVIATTRNCNECKIRNCKWGTCNCSQITANAALDLIKRQKAENEALKELDKRLLKTARLERAEAYKEFAQKAAIELTNAYSSEYARWIDNTLNNLLEELVGDNK